MSTVKPTSGSSVSKESQLVSFKWTKTSYTLLAPSHSLLLTIFTLNIDILILFTFRLPIIFWHLNIYVWNIKIRHIFLHLPLSLICFILRCEVSTLSTIPHHLPCPLFWFESFHIHHPSLIACFKDFSHHLYLLRYAHPPSLSQSI